MTVVSSSLYFFYTSHPLLETESTWPRLGPGSSHTTCTTSSNLTTALFSCLFLYSTTDSSLLVIMSAKTASNHYHSILLATFLEDNALTRTLHVLIINLFQGHALFWIIAFFSRLSGNYFFLSPHSCFTCISRLSHLLLA